MDKLSKNPNILLIVPRLNIGGAETYTAMLARLLNKRGFNVIIASGGGKLASILQKEGFTHYFLPIRFSTYISAIILSYIVKIHKIDLIHANSSAAAITAIRYRKFFCKKIPIVYTSHGVFSSMKSEKLLHNCDKIITVSDFVRNNAIKNGGYNENQLETIYIGIPKPSCENDDKISLKQTLNIPKDAFIIALVARMKNLTNKGHQDLINILSKYQNETKNWHLLVIGSGKAEHKFHSEIKKNNLEKKIHFLGHQLDVQKFTQLADVIVLPSYFETFGLALAEAMAIGKPGVSYAVGGTYEIIENGKNGFLAELKNEDDLFYKLDLLYKNEALRKKMGQEAKKTIANKFSIDEMLSKTLRIYEKLLKKYVNEEKL